jgi:serine/threonine protein kinase
MDYEQGESLHARLAREGTLPEDVLLAILFPMLEGMEAMHNAGMIHRDIKPSNIFIREDGSPVLLDFGSARQALDTYTQTLTNIVSPGYAPIEQYTSNTDKQGPWTDIYGLGATLYKTIFGVPPLEAVARAESMLHDARDPYIPARKRGNGTYSCGLLAAIDHALQFRSQDRPQTVAEWRNELQSWLADPSALLDPVDDVPTMPAPQVVPPAIRANHKTRRRKTRARTIAMRTTGALVLAGLAGFVMSNVLPPQAVDNNVATAHNPVAPDSIAAGAIQSPAREAGTAPAQPSRPDSSTASPEITHGSTAASGFGQASLESKQEDLTSLQIEDLLARAHEDIANLRLSTPAGNNALERYRVVLSMDPANREASLGINAVRDKYLELLYRDLGMNEVHRAERHLRAASKIGPEDEGVRQARDALATKRSQLALRSRIFDSRDRTDDFIPDLGRRSGNRPSIYNLDLDEDTTLLNTD